jgi:hypothetical protein
MNPFSVNDACVFALPSDQNAIDLIEDWTSCFPPEFNVKAGQMPLWHDPRVTWAVNALGGVQGKSVLELGPLEAGHSFMLEQAGAVSVLAIEANKRCFLKCLIAKEVLRLERCRFMLGDFVQFLRRDTALYDVGWVSGVLYHMEDPVELLSLMSKRVNSIYLWTMYMNDAVLSRTWAFPIVGTRTVANSGKEFLYYDRSYAGAESTTNFCGGVYSGAAWLRKEDIMEALRLFGFQNIVIGFDDPNHQNGPAMGLIATK